MNSAAAEIYDIQGRFEQIRAHINAERVIDAMKEAEDSVNAVGKFLDGIGYIPSDASHSSLTDRLYEAQGGNGSSARLPGSIKTRQSHVGSRGVD